MSFLIFLSINSTAFYVYYWLLGRGPKFSSTCFGWQFLFVLKEMETHTHQLIWPSHFNSRYKSLVLVSDCCYNLPQLSDLKQQKLSRILIPLWRLDVQNGFHGAKIRVSAGFCSFWGLKRRMFLCLFQLLETSLARGSFFCLQSQKCNTFKSLSDSMTSDLSSRLLLWHWLSCLPLTKTPMIMIVQDHLPISKPLY